MKHYECLTSSDLINVLLSNIKVSRAGIPYKGCIYSDLIKKPAFYLKNPINKIEVNSLEHLF